MISRRTMIRGMLGGSVFGLGLPLFEQMLNNHGTALAQGIPLPKRYGLYFWGAHGLPVSYRHDPNSGNERSEYLTTNPDLWTPTTTGKDWQLTELLQPLANHKANINVVTGTDVITEIPASPPGMNDGHARGAVVALSANRPADEGYDQGILRAYLQQPSLDQVIAKHEQFYTDITPAFRSLEFGISEAYYIHNHGHFRAISINPPDLLNMPIMDAQQFFDFVFAIPPDTSEVTRRVSVLDVVAEDARQLSLKLGKNDKLRLEQHLTHIQDLTNRLNTGSGGCSVPGKPSLTFDETQHLEKLDVMGDILVAALRCDMTRVFSLMFTPAASLLQMNADGVVNGPGSLQTHEAAHAQGINADAHKVICSLTKHHMAGFAMLLDKLSAEVDVNGQTLLDSSCIFGTSELGDGFYHGCQEMPCVIAGKAGGSLDTGFHIRDERGNFCRAHYTILRAMGIDVDTYGGSGAETSNAFEFLKA